MRLAALSRRAIDLAAQLPRGDVRRTARWLYRFGTLPRGAELERDFGTEDDPAVVLGLTFGGRVRLQLGRSYEGASYPGWLSFKHMMPPSGNHAGYKIYVSPRPEALVEAFPVIADQFSRHDVRAFKVGRGLEGLLRPDKIVAYFDTPEHRDIVAAALDRALAGCPVHGVPFTADFAGVLCRPDGLVSHGFDPQPGTETPSWRAWVTRRLAEHLLAAESLPGEGIADAAVRAASADGLDTVGWTADEALLIRAEP